MSISHHAPHPVISTHDAPERFDARVLVLVNPEVLSFEEAAPAVGAHVLAALVRAAVLLVGVPRAQVLATALHRTSVSRRGRGGGQWHSED